MKHAERPANEIPKYIESSSNRRSKKKKKETGNLCELSGRGELTQLTT